MTKQIPIVMKGVVKLEDESAREWLSKLQSKVDMINERTKIHTIRLNELDKITKEKK